MKKPVRAAAPAFGQELEPGIEEVCQETLTALYPLREVAVRRHRRLCAGRERENHDPEHDLEALRAERRARPCTHSGSDAFHCTPDGTGGMSWHHSDRGGSNGRLNGKRVASPGGSIHVNEFVQGEDRLAQIGQRQALRFSFWNVRIPHRALPNLRANEDRSRVQFLA